MGVDKSLRSPPALERWGAFLPETLMVDCFILQPYQTLYAFGKHVNHTHLQYLAVDIDNKSKSRFSALVMAIC